MSYHFIHIDNPCHIYTDTKRLMIRPESGQATPIASHDCAALILNHFQITITQNALKLCAEAGAIIIATDEKHLPISLSLPFNINMQGAKKPWLQAQYLGSPLSKQLWCLIVQAKINGQATMLQKLNSRYYNRLAYIAKNTDPHSAHKNEALAANLYWREFFKSLNSKSKREKQNAQEPINQHLNYGYAIIRALMARALAGAGLCLNFGLGHVRKDNPFNLVEDMMEPFRPIIDDIVYQFCHDNPPHALVPTSKTQLVKTILESEIKMAEKTYRLIPAIEVITNHYAIALEKAKPKLILPFALKSKAKS